MKKITLFAVAGSLILASCSSSPSACECMELSQKLMKEIMASGFAEAENIEKKYESELNACESLQEKYTEEQLKAEVEKNCPEILKDMESNAEMMLEGIGSDLNEIFGEEDSDDSEE